MDTFISIAPYICGFLLSVITGCITLEWLTLWRDLALEKEEKEWADRMEYRALIERVRNIMAREEIERESKMD